MVKKAKVEPPVVAVVKNDSTPIVGRTMRVAEQVARRGSGEIVKASELIAIVPAKGRSMSLSARRFLNLMIQAAAGAGWTGEIFEISKALLRREHKGSEQLTQTLDELMTTTIHFSSLSSSGMSDDAVPILTRRGIDRANTTGAMVRFRFSPEVTEMLRNSETYAVLESRAVLGFQSKYSMAIYEIGCQLVHRQNPSITVTPAKLRELVNVSADRYAVWTDMRRFVLKQAQSEIDQLAHFVFSWEEIKKGRQVLEVKLSFTLKPGDDAIAAAEERERHSAGRKARREGRVDHIVTPSPALSAPGADSFPAKSIRYSEPWQTIAKKHGGGWDIDQIAEAFRVSPAANLTGERLVNAFTTFCEKWTANRKSPA